MVYIKVEESPAPVDEPEPPRKPVSVSNPTRREKKAVKNPATVNRV